MGLDPAVRAYVESAYPKNADYRVGERELRPRLRLRSRWRRIRSVWPRPLASFLDVGCSTGFFVLEAAARPDCERALGIDVHEPDLAAAEAVRAHLGRGRARFLRLTLSELAARVTELGGPFETTQLVNVYPYLVYGSNRSESCYGDHATVAALLARVTAGRLVFSNRLELADLPRHVRARVAALGAGAAPYGERVIRAALEEHFVIESHGRLGRRPLWVAQRRPRSSPREPGRPSSAT